jgi:hypothetical protein
MHIFQHVYVSFVFSSYSCQVTPPSSHYITMFQFKFPSKLLRHSFSIWSDSHIAIKLSQATSHTRWLKADETNISRTISVLVLRELKWPGTQSVSYIYLPGPNVHGCTLASRDWWVESTACSAWPCFLIMQHLVHSIPGPA